MTAHHSGGLPAPFVHHRDDDPALRESRVSGEQLARGHLLDVRRDAVTLPDGNTAHREYVVHPGAVAILAQLDDGRFLFERQFRYPVGRVMWEVPAGKIDPGEDILLTAQRELREETGHVANSWRHLGVFHPCIGYSDERIEVFFARGLRFESAALDAGEFLEVVPLHLEEAVAGVRAGLVTDGKTLAALFWAEKVLHHGW